MSEATDNHEPEEGQPAVSAIMVCAGYTELTGQKLGVEWLIMKGGEPTLNSFAMKRSSKLACQPGAMRTFEVLARNNDGFPSRIAMPGEFLGMYEDAEQVAAWQAASRATERAYSSRAEEKKAATRNVLAETLEPLRRHYWKLTPRQRISVELLVIEYLRRREQPK